MSGLTIKVFLAAAAVTVFFIAFSLVQEMNRRLHIQREVVRLEEEARELNKTIIEMENLNQYFRTDAFAERMAREKLNYRADGENVVLIAEEYEDPTPVFDIQKDEPRSIPRRWWDTFFVKPLLPIT